MMTGCFAARGRAPRGENSAGRVWHAMYVSRTLRDGGAAVARARPASSSLKPNWRAVPRPIPMLFSSPADAAFALTISRLAYCNPFLPERIEHERDALGPEFVDA